MSDEFFNRLVLFIFMITIVERFVVMPDLDFNSFNPIRNYKEWISMNWFGVIFFTILLNVICPVYALCYWFYKLCTVGRK